MEDYITQEQAIELTGRTGQFSQWNLVSEKQIRDLCNAAIRSYIDQQAKELQGLPMPVLPELDADDQQWLSDNPNTSDIVAFIRGYATGHGQQCAAHAREVALREVLDLCLFFAENSLEYVTDRISDLEFASRRKGTKQ